MKIEGVEVGAGQPCRTVAEISNSHNGDMGRALRMIDAAKDAGADFVKFQAYTPDELVALRGDGPAPDPWGSQGWSMRQLYAKAATPLHWLPTLFAHARKVGVVPFASFFGLESLCALEKVECPAYKIAALDNGHRHLFDYARATGKPVAVSYRLTDATEDSDHTPLYCPPGYPQSAFRFRHAFTPDYTGDPRFTGLSYHGRDYRVCLTAVACGAKLIECHFQLNGERSELENEVSLTNQQFGKMVRDIRRVEALL